MKKILLVDSSNLSARSFFAFTTQTSQGDHSGMFYGSLLMVENKIRQFGIDDCYICMDRKPYWRTTIFPEYKIGRVGITSKMDPDTAQSFNEQRDDLVTFFSNSGMNTIAIPTFEADDVIAALAWKLSKNNKVYIYSGDHDFLQLVGPNITFIKAKQRVSDEIYNENKFIEQYGITPEQYTQVLAIGGDAGDGIPSMFATKNGTEETGYYWENPSRIFSHGKIISIIKNNSVENLLEGKMNPVKGVGSRTENLFLNINEKNIKRYKDNLKLVNLRDGKEKFEAILTMKNQYPKSDIKKGVMTHLLEKYECNSMYLIDKFPYYKVNNKSDSKELPKTNGRSLFELMKKSAGGIL